MAHTWRNCQEQMLAVNHSLWNKSSAEDLTDGSQVAALLTAHNALRKPFTDLIVALKMQSAHQSPQAKFGLCFLTFYCEIITDSQEVTKKM